jgi:hypothetical protein
MHEILQIGIGLAIGALVGVLTLPLAKRTGFIGDTKPSTYIWMAACLWPALLVWSIPRLLRRLLRGRW